MKKLLSLIAITACCSLGQASYAQNIEGQIIASQFGQYQVPGIATGSLAFQPASCQVFGGGKNFVAFATGVPVKIVDANPLLTEVGTPSSVNITGCSISMATTYIHTTPFYATSGTGGLQEALTNGPNKQGGPNTVILNADWYTQVAPSNPATVIAAVKGSTKLGLVDVTTIPYTVYAWNGSAYVVVTYGGGGASFPSTSGIVFNTTTAASRNATFGDLNTLLGTGNLNALATNLWGTPALPNGVTATSGTVGENDNKLGTNAAIYASKLDSIPNTGLVLKGAGIAGKSVAATLNVDYLAPNYWAALTGCTTPGNVYSPQSNTCISPGSGALPSGTGIVGVISGVGGLAVAGQDYLGPNLDNGLNAHGIATSSANQNSYTLFQTGDVWNGAAGAGIFYGQQVIVGAGANANSILNFNCAGATSGGCGASFNYPVSGVNNLPTGDKSTAFASNLNVFNDMPALPAQYFGAFGDAYQPPNGCSTTASSTTVSCPDGPFVSTDVGKQVWVSGAGASGHAFNATITTFTSNTDVVVSAAATGTVSNGRGIIGHDDTTAVNACFQYSASNAVQCVLKAIPTIGDGLTGFLIGTGPLLLAKNNFLEESSATNVTGSGQSSSTNLFCEFNGDCMSLVAGPIQGANVTNLSFDMDRTQPASRGIHANPQAGTFGVGPFTNSNFTNVQVNNPALECLWLDGGGGPGYGFNLPNQYLTFSQFFCSGPNQSHPANLIKMTGQAAQIIFINGQTNGQGWNGVSASLYPNPQVLITELTSTLGDTPVDVKFYGFTIEVGTQGLFIGNGANNIHFDNGYIENVSSPFSVTSATANTFNGNHIANSGNIGAVYQFTSGVVPAGASVRDNQVYGGVAVPAAVATCTGNDQVDFANNYIASGVSTNSCLYGVTVSAAGSPLTANTCTSPATKTIVGVTPKSVISAGYSADPTSLTGWGSTGGMVFHAWPSANDTVSWNVCNQSGSSITYGAITFNMVFK